MKPETLHEAATHALVVRTTRFRRHRPSFPRKRESTSIMKVVMDSRFRGNDGSSIHATIRGASPWTRGDSLRRVAGGIGIALPEGG